MNIPNYSLVALHFARGRSPKERAGIALTDLLNLRKVKFNTFTHNFETTTLEAFEELRRKKAVIETGGYFSLCIADNIIDVTTSTYCENYPELCPSRSEEGWKKCYKLNIPCKKFIYIPKYTAN